MTIPDASAGPVSVTLTPAANPAEPAPPSWLWQRHALILAGAAQLITVSALAVLAIGGVKLSREQS